MTKAVVGHGRVIYTSLAGLGMMAELGDEGFSSVGAGREWKPLTGVPRKAVNL